MRLTHNHIVLTMPDGREVSIIQNQRTGEGLACGQYGKTCEIWVDGEPEPLYNKTLTQVLQYLSEIK